MCPCASKHQDLCTGAAPCLQSTQCSCNTLTLCTANACTHCGSLFWSLTCLIGNMQALSNGDRERCRSLLFDARQNVIMSLATVSTESVSNVNPAILQLQQLQCLQEAWNFKWTSLSLSSSPTTRQVQQPAAVDSTSETDSDTCKQGLLS